MIISSEEENPYSITPEDLEEIINLSKSKISPSKIETEWMGMKGISQRIKSDLKKGLSLEEEVRGYSARKTLYIFLSLSLFLSSYFQLSTIKSYMSN